MKRVIALNSRRDQYRALPSARHRHGIFYRGTNKSKLRKYDDCRDYSGISDIIDSTDGMGAALSWRQVASLAEARPKVPRNHVICEAGRNTVKPHKESTSRGKNNFSLTHLDRPNGFSCHDRRRHGVPSCGPEKARDFTGFFKKIGVCRAWRHIQNVNPSRQQLSAEGVAETT